MTSSTLKPMRATRMPPPVDLAVAAIVAVVTAMVVWTGGLGVTATAQRPGAPAMALAVASAVVLVARRIRPLEVFTTATMLTAVLAVAWAPIGLPVAPGVALYTLAARRPSGTPLRPGITVAVVGLVVYLAACWWSLHTAPWAEAFHAVLLWAACWFAGERTRLQHGRMEELRRDAARAREIAAADERARLARDLHDSAGHAINVIAVRAGAARLRSATDPDSARTALAAIEDLARATAADLDRLVGTLRAGATEPPTPRTIDAISGLVDTHRSNGHAIDATIASCGPYGIEIEQAAFRIAQEALTNATRHGTGPINLHVLGGTTTVAITVDNHHTGPTGPPGHGLLGAEERAHLVGGTLTTETTGGRFRLRATLPATGRTR